VTIRHATERDTEALVALGATFLATSPYRVHLPPNPDQWRRTVAWLIAHGAVFVAERNGGIDGMLGAALAPHPMSGELFGSELFWWVRPEARGTTGLKLLRAAEAWTRAQGGAFLQLAAPDARAERLYERLGYARIEVGYQRRWE
jgi:hypothetical protein